MQTKEYFTKYYRINRTAKRAQMNARYRQVRMEAMATLGAECVRCGYDADFRALQIDHINGGGSAEQRKLGNLAICKKIIAGAEGYQLLCANCNTIKMYENNER